MSRAAVGGHAGGAEQERGLPPTVSLVPPLERLRRGPRVRGRERLVGGLARAGAGVHVLHGMGGDGKTTVALSVAKRALDDGRDVWWISAEDPRRLLPGLNALAGALGVDQRDLYYGSLPDLLWGALERRGDGWLLIIDGVDDSLREFAVPPGCPLDGDGLIRVPTSGTLLITSRVSSAETWSDRATLHRVAMLSEDDAARVLCDLASPAAGGREAAGRLGQRLCGLPLALRIAGGYLAEVARLPAELRRPDAIRTFDDYREALDKGGPVEFFTGSEPGDHRAVIGQTWELSLDLLSRQGRHGARPLLRLLSHLGPDPIPYGLILRPEALAASGLFRGLTEISLFRLLRALADVNLVDLGPVPHVESGTPAVVKIHLVLRDACRYSAAAAGERKTMADLVTDMLAEAARSLDPRDSASWAQWALLASHCSAPLDFADAVAPGRRASLLAPAVLAARYLRSAGRLPEAERAYGALMGEAGQLLDADHPVILDLRHDLARLWLALGRTGEAMREFTRVRAARERVLGPHHPDTLTTLHYQGRALREAGLFDQAERVLTRVLELRELYLGPRHRDTLTSRNNIAELLARQGDSAEAAELFTRVLDDRLASLGPEHPATLVTRFHLAELQRMSGDAKEAERSLAALYADGRRLMGKAHPRTLRTGHSLGGALMDLGRFADASEVLGEVHRLRVESLGERHPATTETEHLYAAARIAAGPRSGRTAPGGR